MPTPTIAFVSNTSWGIFRFRHQLIRSLTEEGFRILVIAPEDSYTHHLKSIRGVEFIGLKKLSATGLSILDDLHFYREIKKIYAAQTPALIFHYTIKPNIYGTLAAAHTGIPSISVITGLGYAFMKRSPVKWAAGLLYRLALSKSRETWFLNQDDRNYFVSNGLVPRNKTSILPGEGIDTHYYSPRQPRNVNPPYSGSTEEEDVHFNLKNLNREKTILSEISELNSETVDPVFLLMARLIREKGIIEFVEAARRIRLAFPGTEFLLMGMLNEKSPSSITRAQLDAWQEEKIIRYLGSAEDVRPFIDKADCIVLPSWREGLPLSLLEAGAMGKPVITTNTAGCRDVITDGFNGILCEPRDPVSLEQAMNRFIHLSPSARQLMGESARKHVEENFGMETIIRFYKDKIHHYIQEC